jgi:ankyrin repeat protein
LLGHPVTSEQVIAQLEATNKYGNTALHIAELNDHVEVIEALLAKGAKIDAQNNNGCTPLYIAALNGQTTVVQLLITKGADVNAKTSEAHGQWTPLHAAAEKGYTEVVEALVESRNTSIDAKNKNGCTPLYIAALRGKTEAVRSLIAKGADVNAVTSEAHGQWTALHIAVQKGYTAVVEALLSNLVTSDQITSQLNAKAKLNRTPLHLAVWMGHVAIVRILLDKGADIEAQDKWGFTPLHSVIDLKASSEDSDGSQRRQIGTNITAALLAKLQEQGKDIGVILGNDILKRIENADELEEWKAEVQEPVNEWYRRLLQDAGVDVEALWAE